MEVAGPVAGFGGGEVEAWSGYLYNLNLHSLSSPITCSSQPYRQKKNCQNDIHTHEVRKEEGKSFTIQQNVLGKY